MNVYNATERPGWRPRPPPTCASAASRCRRSATTRSRGTSPVAAEVRYGTTGTASAKLVLALVKGAKAVKDSRTDSSVDLVLGAKFTRR